MTDVITSVEDALVQKTIAVVVNAQKQSLLKTCDHLPGELNLGLLKKLSKRSPSVLWSFLGGRPSDTENSVQLKSAWVAFIVTSHASGEKERRRGDARTAGAYQILCKLIPEINNFTLQGVGTFNFKQARNLYSNQLEGNHVALYAASFELPVTLSLEEDAALDTFQAFHVDYDIPDHETAAEHNKWLLEPVPDYTGSKPDASDDVELEQ